MCFWQSHSPGPTVVLGRAPKKVDKETGRRQYLEFDAFLIDRTCQCHAPAQPDKVDQHRRKSINQPRGTLDGSPLGS